MFVRWLAGQRIYRFVQLVLLRYRYLITISIILHGIRFAKRHIIFFFFFYSNFVKFQFVDHASVNERAKYKMSNRYLLHAFPSCTDSNNSAYPRANNLFACKIKCAIHGIGHRKTRILAPARKQRTVFFFFHHRVLRGRCRVNTRNFKINTKNAQYFKSLGMRKHAFAGRTFSRARYSAAIYMAFIYLSIIPKLNWRKRCMVIGIIICEGLRTIRRINNVVPSWRNK